MLVALGLSSEILPLFLLMKWVTAMMTILLGALRKNWGAPIVPLSGEPGGRRHPICSVRLGGAVAAPPPHACAPSCARCPAAVLVDAGLTSSLLSTLAQPASTLLGLVIETVVLGL